MIYTSYYAKIGKFDKSKFHLVAISNKIPAWAEVNSRLRSIAPNDELLDDIKSGKINEEEYTARYLEQLSHLDVKNLIEFLDEAQRITGKDLVLFCYEASDKFCHRHLFSKWFNEHSEITKISEYKF